MKVVVDAKTDKVLGIHLVGPEVAEILQVGLWLLHVWTCTGAGCDHFTGKYSTYAARCGPDSAGDFGLLHAFWAFYACCSFE